MSMREMRRTLGIVLLLLTSAVICVAQGSSQTPRVAPYFILPTWDGKVLKSTNLKGQVVLLEFFQTWCPDCQETSPKLQKLFEHYKDRGLAVIGISHDKDGAKSIEPFIKKYGITYPILLGDLSIAINYIEVTPQKPSFQIPFVVLVDRKGNIAGEYEQGIHKEATDVPLLEGRIKKLLAE